MLPPPALTHRFLESVALAQEVHGDQRRTGTQIPYLAHLLVVSGLVMEDGGDEDEAIAAILHDAVEDGGGRALLERISGQFGDRVAVIVEGLTDNLDAPEGESWIDRKRRYLAHLPEVTDDAILRVALADKVHNARSLVRDYREEGHALWDRFTQKTARDQLWYYSGLLAFFQERRPGPLTEDLLRAVGELSWLVANDEAQRAERVQLWLDPDFHEAQAPEPWIQVRTADEAIQLLEAFPVAAISFDGTADAFHVIGWLTGQTADQGRDRWPSEEIAFHDEPDAGVQARLASAIEANSSLRGDGAGAWRRRPGPVAA
jgi:hypothetical protein